MKKKNVKKKTLLASVTQAWINPQCGCVKYRRSGLAVVAPWLLGRLKFCEDTPRWPLAHKSEVSGLQWRDGWPEIWFGFARRLGAFGNSFLIFLPFFSFFSFLLPFEGRRKNRGSNYVDPVCGDPPGVGLRRDWKHTLLPTPTRGHYMYLYLYVTYVTHDSSLLRGQGGISHSKSLKLTNLEETFPISAL